MITRASSSQWIECLSTYTILMVHGLLLGWIAFVNAPVFDEIAHIPAGLVHWRSGNFDLYRVNPPLMRMIAVVPLLIVDPELGSDTYSVDPYLRPEFSLGTRFIQANRSNALWYFTVCRWAQIPVSIFGGWICFRWARELFGKSSAFVALTLWCFCPTILAWGATITPDIGGAAFGVWAGYTFWRWLKVPVFRHALISGLAMGVALLAKSTWVILFGLWPLLWMISCLEERQWSITVSTAIQITIILSTSLFVVNLGYGFEGSCKRLRDFTFISELLGGDGAHQTPGNRFRYVWPGAAFVPVPANYLRGIDTQRYGFEYGKWSYLRGETKFGGWWHYYIYALAVKTPIGTLLLLGVAVALIIERPGYLQSFKDEAVLMLPALAILVLVSSQTGFNRYLRYILPAIPFLYIFTSRVGKTFEANGSRPRFLTIIGIASTVVGSLMVHPHSMSFFNVLAGGPTGGPAHLLDANVDWGQDLLHLKRFVDRNPHVSPINLAYFGLADPKLARFSHTMILDRSGPGESLLLIPGWYAVSVNHIYGYRHEDRDRPVFACFQNVAPDAMAGYSIYIYNIGFDDLAVLNE